MMIPTKLENEKGLHQRYAIRKIVGYEKKLVGLGTKWEGEQTTPIFKEVDEGSEYFVLRLDSGGSDPNHIKACRKAVLTYADEIEPHLPELAKDLRDRYGSNAL